MLALRWRKGSDKKTPVPTAELWVSTPGNHTGTEGLSDRVLEIERREGRQNFELYGSGCGFTAGTKPGRCAIPCSV